MTIVQILTWGFILLWAGWGLHLNKSSPRLDPVESFCIGFIFSIGCVGMILIVSFLFLAAFGVI